MICVVGYWTARWDVLCATGETGEMCCGLLERQVRCAVGYWRGRRDVLWATGEASVMCCGLLQRQV